MTRVVIGESLKGSSDGIPGDKFDSNEIRISDGHSKNDSKFQKMTLVEKFTKRTFSAI